MGETEESPSCQQFQKRPEDFVGALTNERFRDIFHEILAESFVIEQDVRIAVDTIRAQLQTQGANITLDPSKFHRQTGRMVDLYVLYRVVNAIGLSRYADTIMHKEIEKQYETFDKKKVKVL